MEHDAHNLYKQFILAENTNATKRAQWLPMIHSDIVLNILCIVNAESSVVQDKLQLRPAPSQQ